MTQGDRENFCAYLEWVLDLPLTLAQRNQAAEHITKIWEAKDGFQAQIVLEALIAHADLANHSPDDLATFRASVEDELLKTLRLRYRSKPLAQWIGELKPNAQKTVAPGDPPLTRQAADAYAELIAFVAVESKAHPTPLSKAELEELSAGLSKDYPSYSAEEKLALSEMPSAWAALRTSISGMSSEKRDQLRNAWRKALSHSPDAGSVPLPALQQTARAIVTQVPSWL